MRRRPLVSLPVLLLLLSGPFVAANPGLTLPEGFVATEWADSSVANDVYCITFTSDGRLVVAGRNYLRLIDGTTDDRAGKVRDFAHPLADGAMGLCWNEGHLYATGGGGLRRYRDVDAGGLGKPSELLFACKTGGEHDAHAVLRHNDGWFYLLCGNATGIAARHATLPGSPIREPLAGCLVRFPPDFKGCEIVADGFRNAYGLDVNAAGELFTYDSDNERCVGLPWYEFTRAYHILPGGRHGWMSPQRAETWRMPPYFVDVVPPLAHLDRGSPTGVVAYRHVQFPAKYRDGIFALDWTFGRIWFLELTPNGGSYRATATRFLQTTGEAGFAPTAAAVHPVTGDLFVSIGGRGTRGAIYRIRYPSGLAKIATERATARVPARRTLDWQPEQKTAWLRQATHDDLHQRRIALEYLTRYADRYETPDLVAVLRENLRCDDRPIRQATARLIRTLSPEAQDRVSEHVTESGSRVTLALAGLEKGPLLELATDPRWHSSYALWGLRCTQRWLGDCAGGPGKGSAFEGYTLAGKGGTLTVEQRTALCRMLPTGDHAVNREATRILALIRDDRPEAREAVLRCLRGSANAADDVHYLLVLSRLPGERAPAVTEQVAATLLALDERQALEKQAIDSNWPRRLAELYKELASRDPALNRGLLASVKFGRPAHALFTRAADFDRVAAARRFLTRSGNAGFVWSADLVHLLSVLPVSESRPVLRELWGEVGLDDAILPLLARDPEKVDRPRLVEALALSQPSLVQEATAALAALGPSGSADERFALIKALRDVPPGKEFDSVRTALVAVLAADTRAKGTTYPEWLAWLHATDPVRAKRLEVGGVDRAAWGERLGKIDWATGDAERGRQIYAKASCATCHSGAQALGPDLRGAAGRFSRDDLFSAILDPSREVPVRYRTSVFTTEAGKVYQGIVIYEATDSLLLQTGPATTIRLDSPRIRERRSAPQSLMPAGLLDKLTDREIADLLAFLRALK